MSVQQRVSVPQVDLVAACCVCAFGMRWLHLWSSKVVGCAGAPASGRSMCFFFYGSELDAAMIPQELTGVDSVAGDTCAMVWSLILGHADMVTVIAHAGRHMCRKPSDAPWCSTALLPAGISAPADKHLVHSCTACFDDDA